LSDGGEEPPAGGALALDRDRNLWFVEPAANKLARITCRG
jgi:hypothetical protein